MTQSCSLTRICIIHPERARLWLCILFCCSFVALQRGKEREAGVFPVLMIILGNGQSYQVSGLSFIWWHTGHTNEKKVSKLTCSVWGSNLVVLVNLWRSAYILGQCIIRLYPTQNFAWLVSLNKTPVSRKPAASGIYCSMSVTLCLQGLRFWPICGELLQPESRRDGTTTRNAENAEEAPVIELHPVRADYRVIIA